MKYFFFQRKEKLHMNMDQRKVHISTYSRANYPIQYVSFTPEEIRGTFFGVILTNPDFIKQVYLTDGQGAGTSLASQAKPAVTPFASQAFPAVVDVVYVFDDSPINDDTKAVNDITYDNILQWRKFMDHGGDITKRTYPREFLLFLDHIQVMQPLIDDMSDEEYFMFEARNDYADYQDVLRVGKEIYNGKSNRYIVSTVRITTSNNFDYNISYQDYEYQYAIPEEFTTVLMGHDNGYDIIVLYDGHSKIRLLVFRPPYLLQRRKSERFQVTGGVYEYLDLVLPEEIEKNTTLEITSLGVLAVIEDNNAPGGKSYPYYLSFKPIYKNFREYFRPVTEKKDNPVVNVNEITWQNLLEKDAAINQDRYSTETLRLFYNEKWNVKELRKLTEYSEVKQVPQDGTPQYREDGSYLYEITKSKAVLTEKGPPRTSMPDVIHPYLQTVSLGKIIHDNFPSNIVAAKLPVKPETG